MPSCVAPAILITILAVVDGDTLRVRVDGNEDRLRLACMDAPETARPGPADDQPWAAEASAFLRELTADHTGCLAPDPDQAPRDRYKRRLGYLKLEDGRDVGAEVLRAGLARVWERGRCSRKGGLPIDRS